MVRLATLAAFAVVALVPAAQGAARPQTTAPPPVVNIRVLITDTGVFLSPKKAARGDYARFILTNAGNKPHTFTIGSAKRGTGVQAGFSRALKPKEQKILLLFLDYRGKVPYWAEDRSKPRMKGILTIA
jgi:hypothetical protein